MAGLIKAPPMSAVKLLRKLERAYSVKVEELDLANKTIANLVEKVEKLENQLKQAKVK